MIKYLLEATRRPENDLTGSGAKINLFKQSTLFLPPYDVGLSELQNLGIDVEALKKIYDTAFKNNNKLNTIENLFTFK